MKIRRKESARLHPQRLSTQNRRCRHDWQHIKPAMRI
jgi:hypothetical protein